MRTTAGHLAVVSTYTVKRTPFLPENHLSLEFVRTFRRTNRNSTRSLQYCLLPKLSDLLFGTLENWNLLQETCSLGGRWRIWSVSSSLQESNVRIVQKVMQKMLKVYSKSPIGGTGKKKRPTRPPDFISVVYFYKYIRIIVYTKQQKNLPSKK